MKLSVVHLLENAFLDLVNYPATILREMLAPFEKKLLLKHHHYLRF